MAERLTRDILSRAEPNEFNDPAPEVPLTFDELHTTSRRLRLAAACVAVAVLILLPVAVACFGGESARVSVASARVRFEARSQPILPDEPPNVPVPKVMNAAARLAVTLHTTTNCGWCDRLKADLKRDGRLNVTEVFNVIPPGVPATVFPFVTFKDRSGRLRYDLEARTAASVLDAVTKGQEPIKEPIR